MSFLSALGAVCLAIAKPFAPVAKLPPSGARHDAGGDVLAYEKAVARLIKSGEPYVAPLHCKSAATMLLAAPNVRWRPNGKLYFHSASLDGRTGPFVDAFNRIMSRHYPPRVRRWFRREGPGATRSTEYTVIPVRELIERGEIHPTKD